MSVTNNLKNAVKNLLKGIVVGVGGIAPGLSGSVLLVIFGLYEKAVNAISTLFKSFKKNMLFLVPLVLGFGIGVLLFSKVVDFFLDSYEMQTRFAFLGLVLGTIPLFYKEVRKNGFKKKYYIYTVIAAIAGLGLLFFKLYGGSGAFSGVENPSILQSVLLGVAVAGSSIIPGVDSAVILSALGLYKLYVSSLAELNFSVLLPAGAGLIAGAFLISILMNALIKHFYTATFSVIFGLFISIIPSVMLNDDNAWCVSGFGMNAETLISIVLLVLGFALAFYLGDIQKNNERIKKIFSRSDKQKDSVK